MAYCCRQFLGMDMILYLLYSSTLNSFHCIYGKSTKSRQTHTIAEWGGSQWTHMAAARITFRDNRQQQLKVEVTQLVRVCQCVCTVVGSVCEQRHSGVPQNYIYICIHKNETEATQQSQLAPSNNHPSIRSPTPPTSRTTPPYPRSSWFLFCCHSWCN